MNKLGVNTLINYTETLHRYKNNQQSTELYNNSDNDIAVVYEKNTSNVQCYGLYSVAKTSTVTFNSNQDMQSALSGLGFYSGPTDGQLGSERTKKAIKDFQRVYGLDITGKMNTNTKEKLKKASTMRKKCIMDSGFEKLTKKLKLDYKQKQDFLNTWTFLRVGMGLTKKQATGVCGNIYAESGFSSDNAQNEIGNYTIHDPDYKYKVKDDVGYGLLQWTIADRKKGLKNMAKKMELDVSNINVQLAFFREEMGSNVFKNAWKEICKSDSYKEVSDIFLERIEMPRICNYTERRNNSKTIFQYMKSH